jgi:hypothetical protein
VKSHLVLVKTRYCHFFQKWRIRKNNQILQLVRQRPVLVPQVMPTHPLKQTPHHLRNLRQAGVLHLHLPRSAAHQILGPAVVRKSGVEGIVEGSRLAFLADYFLGSP